MGKQWKQWETYLGRLQNHCRWWLQPWIKRCLLLGRKAMTNLDNILKSFANKGLSSQSYGFSSSHVWMWELDCKLSWVPKKSWVLLSCGVGEDSWESLGLQGDQSWVYIGRTDVEAETPILQPPDAMSWLIGKDPDAGKDWGQVEKGTTEEEMVGWHHWLNGDGLGWTPGFVDGQWGLACRGSWGHKESDTTEQLNWTE